jgi:hypothetical protein
LKTAVTKVAVPTTWKHNHIVHEVTFVRHEGFRYRFRTACGNLGRVDDYRAFVKDRPADCLDCIAGDTQRQYDGIRGHSADQVWYDEVQDTKTSNPCAEILIEYEVS